MLDNVIMHTLFPDSLSRLAQNLASDFMAKYGRQESRTTGLGLDGFFPENLASLYSITMLQELLQYLVYQQATHAYQIKE